MGHNFKLDTYGHHAIGVFPRPENPGTTLGARVNRAKTPIPMIAKIHRPNSSFRLPPQAGVHLSWTKAERAGRGTGAMSDGNGEGWDSFAGLTEDWLAYLTKVKGLAGRTVDAYEEDVCVIFADYLRAAWSRCPALSTLTVSDLDDYVQWRAKEGSRQTGLALSEETIRRNIAGLRSFLKWAFRRGHIPTNLLDLWEGPRKPRRKAVVFLTAEEIAALLAGPFEKSARSAWVQERNRAILHVLAYGGLRPNEIARLNVDDYVASADMCCFVIRETKGRADRMQPVNEILAGIMDAYLSVRPSAPDGVLFPSLRGLERMTCEAVRRMVSAHAERCGIETSPKQIRSGFAMSLYARERDVLVCKEALGHASIHSTMRYVEAHNEDVTEAVKRLKY